MSKRTCAIEACDGRPIGRGWCSMHYNRWHRTGDPLSIRRPQRWDVPCSIDGCDGKVEARGWCSRHYDNYLRHGHPIAKKWLPRPCDQCGILIDKPKTIKQRYCTATCRNRAQAAYRRARAAGYHYVETARIKILHRDCWVCHLCSSTIESTLAYPDPMAASIDHLIPVSLESSPGHVSWNLAAAHLQCNYRKGTTLSQKDVALAYWLRSQEMDDGQADSQTQEEAA